MRVCVAYPMSGGPRACESPPRYLSFNEMIRNGEVGAMRGGGGVGNTEVSESERGEVCPRMAFAYSCLGTNGGRILNVVFLFIERI